MNKWLLVLLITISFSLASCSPSTTTSTTSFLETTNTTDINTSSSDLTERVFTLSELATYNGDNGGLAYVAINSVVYDVTNVSNWSNGWHEGMHLAGTDATTIFASSPHSTAFINEYPIVGTLSN